MFFVEFLIGPVLLRLAGFLSFFTVVSGLVSIILLDEFLFEGAVGFLLALWVGILSALIFIVLESLTLWEILLGVFLNKRKVTLFLSRFALFFSLSCLIKSSKETSAINEL